jgi:hypothetical protein
VAKKQTINTNIFAKTEPAEQPEKKEKPKRTPLGVQLTQAEITALDEIKEEFGVNRHVLLQMAVRYFLDQYKAGNIKTESKKVVRKIILP